MANIFDCQELELLMHGIPKIEMEDWKANTEYTGEFQGSPGHCVGSSMVLGYSAF